MTCCSPLLARVRRAGPTGAAPVVCCSSCRCRGLFYLLKVHLPVAASRVTLLAPPQPAGVASMKPPTPSIGPRSRRRDGSLNFFSHSPDSCSPLLSRSFQPEGISRQGL